MAEETEQPKLTFGQEAVGITFNPSGDEDVNKAKQLSADLIDLIKGRHDKDTNNGAMVSSGFKKTFLDAAFVAIIQAQMLVVKYLTFRN